MNNLNNDFEKQWQRRQQAVKEAENSVPGDDVIISMAKMAQNKAFAQEMSPVRNRRRLVWISYIAAACLLLGILLYGLTLPTSDTGEQITFLCNSGCSAEDVIMSANKIVNQ